MPEPQLSIAQYFHERTKYHPETLARASRELDWDNQPIPFKEYKIGTTIDLKLYFKNSFPGDSDRKVQERLSWFLFCSYGITAQIQTMGSPMYLRAAPSAGGLYPAELYLISKGTKELPAGLYNYQAKTHSLIRFWDSDVWPGLQKATFWHPALETTKLAIATTAIFYRSAWRYLDRAYRRIFLDTGHLLGNIELAGSINDYRPHPIGGFNDEALNQLLYLDSSQESVVTLIPLADLLDINQNLPPFRTALPSATQRDYPKIAEGELLSACHQATQIDSDTSGSGGWSKPSEQEIPKDKYNFPFCTKVSTKTSAVEWGENLEGLEKTMLKRRSTRGYSGASISLEQLKALLDFTKNCLVSLLQMTRRRMRKKIAGMKTNAVPTIKIRGRVASTRIKHSSSKAQQSRQ